MSWLSRIGDLLSPAGEGAEDGADTTRGPVERAAPGVAALFEEVSEDTSHAVLDLGPAVGSSLQVYRPFARRVRFADLLAVRSEKGMSEALDALSAPPGQAFDLIFTWSTLDRLRPRARTRLVQRLVEVSAPNARLHAVIDASDRRRAERSAPLQFSIQGTDRMRCEPLGPAPPGGPPLLPADVEDLLAPFRVVRGFTLKAGLREYVAVRGEPRRQRPEARVG